jgi:hypothetical protein
VRAVADVREPERLRPRQGEPEVWWVAGTVVGFVLITAGVIALARTSTASWEREARARRAPPAPPEDGPTLRTELVRTVAAAGVAAVHAGRSFGAFGALVHRHLPRGLRR